MDEENPYAPPKSKVLADELDAGIPDRVVPYIDGKLLVVQNGAELPDRCLKCNSPADGYRFSRSVSWHRPAWFVLVFVSLWLYILVYFFVRWKAKITVGLCPRHRRKRTRAIALGWLIALTGIGLTTAGAWAWNQENPAMIIAGVIAIPMGLTIGILGSRVLVVKRIDNQHIWLSHVSPDYLATFST